jgi:transposase-like protein
VFCDATFCKVSVGAHVVSQTLVVATGVSIDGTREVLGTAVGDSESYEFWREFLASLKARGLSGVHLVISRHMLGHVDERVEMRRRYLCCRASGVGFQG